MGNDRWIPGFLAQGEPARTARTQHFRSILRRYRRRFTPYTAHHYAEQTREIVKEIKLRGAPRILEVGAGCGTESLWFALNGAKVTAIDVTEERLRVGKARKGWLDQNQSQPLSVDFQNISLFDFAATEKFDLIWMEQTFHHVEPRRRIYGALFELLRPGGVLVISEANAWNILLQLQLFLRRGFKTRTHFVDSSGAVIEYGNERITTPFALSRGLRRAGFAVQPARAFRLLPNSNPPKWWISVERWVLRVAPFLSTHFNLVATKPNNL